jgi:hypothetical protein
MELYFSSAGQSAGRGASITSSPVSSNTLVGEGAAGGQERREDGKLDLGPLLRSS